MNKFIFPVALAMTLAINGNVFASDNSTLEKKVPTKESLSKAGKDYIRFCSDCHGKNGEGHGEHVNAPPLKASSVATGSIATNVHFVLVGEPHSKMPSWGITEVSDQLIADVLTYVRNSWGNDDKKKFGEHAGGIVSPELVKQYRDALRNTPAKKDIQI